MACPCWLIYYTEIILFFFLSWDGVGVGIKFEVSAVETAEIRYNYYKRA